VLLTIVVSVNSSSLAKDVAKTPWCPPKKCECNYFKAKVDK
jgi:hypothetical protein